MNNFQRRFSLLVLQLHPPSFRRRFAGEMMLDYEDALQLHGGLWLTFDLCRSLIRQWAQAPSNEVLPELAVSRPAFLAGHYALGFQTILSPYELARGFMLSMLLFSTFWYVEDPLGGHPGDFAG